MLKVLSTHELATSIFLPAGPRSACRLYCSCSHFLRSHTGLHRNLFPPRICIIGGETGDDLSLLATCAFLEEGGGEWRSLPTMPAKRHQCAAVGVGSVLFVMGGAVGEDAWTSELSASLLALDVEAHPSMKAWKSLPSLPGPRGSLAAVHLNGQIYALGGYSANECVGDMDIYNISASVWSSGPSIPKKCSSLGAAVAHGSIYVAGGENKEEGLVQLADLHCFHPLEPPGVWEGLPDMPTPRGMCMIFGLNDYLCVVGGNCDCIGGRYGRIAYGGCGLDLVECFHLPTRTWCVLGHSPRRRFRAAITQTDTRVFVLGGAYSGYDTEELSADTEIIETGILVGSSAAAKLNEAWTRGPDFKEQREFLAAATLFR